MHTQHHRYYTAWESYWSTLSGAPNEVFWDAHPDHAIRQDFQPFFAPELPVVDLGCGHGTQTPFLARHFRHVVGVDVAPAAIALARRYHAAPRVTYRVLDLVDPAQARALHDEIGDANVYLRAVLHQLDPTVHAVAVQAIEELLGERGTLYCIELSAAAAPYFAQLIDPYGPPPALARVWQHGITPGLLREGDLDTLFPPDRFTILAGGDSTIHTVHRLPSGAYASVPACYRIVRRRV
jgi:SAM-dependent methyltransferase